MLGILMTYMTSLRYVKSLRGEGEKISYWAVICTAIFGGSPVLLIEYAVFREIRIEDAKHKNIFLISSLILLIIHILITFLLAYYGLLNFNQQNSVNQSFFFG